MPADPRRKRLPLRLRRASTLSDARSARAEDGVGPVESQERRLELRSQDRLAEAVRVLLISGDGLVAGSEARDLAILQAETAGCAALEKRAEALADEADNWVPWI